MAAVSVLGTTSWAGKSLVATALCRWFSRQGLRVAPFKAQNMSNNARVVAGGEIGVAQYLQALACGIEPDTRMNPVLVKPEADDRSQVVLRGRVDEELSRTPWRRRAPALWPAVEDALRSLLADYELVVIEGAGSACEPNLADIDLSNARVAELAAARALLVTDISRGGSFAHLYGTWALLPEASRRRIRGFVLNRFRGDPGLLPPAPAELERMTGIPTLGVLPWLDHALPDEDGASARAPSGGRPLVAVVAYPAASNLDEFRLLEQAADVVWAREPAQLAGADLVVLPGSKEPPGDLAWLRRTGIAGAVVRRAAEEGRILGVCGGLQLLGSDVAGDAGLGLLPLATSYSPGKLTRRREGRFRTLDASWRALSGVPFAGYEIRQGQTVATGPVTEAVDAGLGYVSGPVLAVYVHGVLESPQVIEALFGARPERSLETTFDELADAVDRHLDRDRLRALAAEDGPASPPRKRPVSTPAPARPRSLVLVNTGDGKGKSTAAFGVLMRAVARGWQTCVIQFVKSGRWKVGEEKLGRELGVTWLKGGDGFSWESPDLSVSAARALDAWRQARAALESGDYRLVVLDEVTYPMNWGWIEADEVVAAIRDRPERVNVIATGRDAPASLLAVADTVTEMVNVRHAFDRGVKARRGIDF